MIALVLVVAYVALLFVAAFTSSRRAYVHWPPWQDEHPPTLDELGFDSYDCSEPMPGPNGCTCGYNGDCNCPFVP